MSSRGGERAPGQEKWGDASGGKAVNHRTAQNLLQPEVEGADARSCLDVPFPAPLPGCVRYERRGEDPHSWRSPAPKSRAMPRCRPTAGHGGGRLGSTLQWGSSVSGRVGCGPPVTKQPRGPLSSLPGACPLGRSLPRGFELSTWHTTASQRGTRGAKTTLKNIRGKGDGNMCCGVCLPHLGCLLWEKLNWAWTLDFGHCPFAPLFYC